MPAPLPAELEELLIVPRAHQQLESMRKAAPQAKRRFIETHRLLTGAEIEEELRKMEEQRAAKGPGGKGKAPAGGTGKENQAEEGGKAGKGSKQPRAAKRALGEATNKC